MLDASFEYWQTDIDDWGKDKTTLNQHIGFIDLRKFQLFCKAQRHLPTDDGHYNVPDQGAVGTCIHGLCN